MKEKKQIKVRLFLHTFNLTISNTIRPFLSKFLIIFFLFFQSENSTAAILTHIHGWREGIRRHIVTSY